MLLPDIVDKCRSLPSTDSLTNYGSPDILNVRKKKAIRSLQKRSELEMPSGKFCPFLEKGQKCEAQKNIAFPVIASNPHGHDADVARLFGIALVAFELVQQGTSLLGHGQTAEGRQMFGEISC